MGPQHVKFLLHGNQYGRLERHEHANIDILYGWHVRSVETQQQLCSRRDDSKPPVDACVVLKACTGPSKCYVP